VTHLSRRFWNNRLWRDHLNGPLYIPDQGRYLLRLLETSGTVDFIHELERLSILGSPWACAILGYLSLMPDTDGNRNPQRAIELCKSHADRNDPYAQFVYAWALLHSGQRNMAIRTMEKAALLNFPPASVDFATFVWNGWGVKDLGAAAALELVARAERTGHKVAFRRRCEFYRSGKFGVVRWLLGNLGFPFALARHALALWHDPVSSSVFTFQWRNGPLLRT
jgi:TPR repeat protein